MAKRKNEKAGSIDKQQKAKLKPTDWTLGLEVVHPKAAGIDVGNEEHYVAVPPHMDEEPVRRFGCFTADLKAMADWLLGCGIQTVALQSTGVYWIPLYEILTERGIQVFVVNARDTKNMPGRKSDVEECQWILKLHVYGLLRKSFRPQGEICVLRALWRQRQQHTSDAARCIQRMQKALTQMNVQIANVLSDLTGVSGQAIVKAILEGERDPYELADLCQAGVKASRETIAKSLEGNWREEHLFVLGQEWATYRHFKEMIGGCDATLLKQVRSMEEKGEVEKLAPCRRNKRPRGQVPSNFDLRTELFRITGVDLTAVESVNVLTAQTFISEVGLDVNAFPTEGNLVSWLNLAPRNKVSGGKVIGRDQRKIVNRAGQGLRMAVGSLRNSQTYLGAQYRRLVAKLGPERARKAMAAKVARILYRMLKYGQEYVDKGAQFYEEKYRQQQVRAIAKKAADLGFQLTPAA